jgi:hypothetical protein
VVADDVREVAGEDLPQPDGQLATGTAAELPRAGVRFQKALLDDIGRIDPALQARVEL